VGRIVYGFDVNAVYGYSIKMDANSSSLKFNNGWDGTGTDRMTLSSTGNVSISGDLTVSGNNLYLVGGSPTLYLRDTDQRSSMIHCNGNIMYFLRADGTNSINWATYNNEWSLMLYLDNNNVRFGADVNCASLSSRGSVYATTTIQDSGAYYFANNLWNNSNEGENRVFYASSGPTYIRGAGTIFDRPIVFRSTTQFDMGYFQYNNFYCYGPVN
jgi:hypothetical protein